jgi:ubiquinol-cytochrome c reductase iron-sulfur subunit
VRQATERKAERRAAGGFLVTTVAAGILALVYWRGGNPRLEGILLALALAGLGYGFVVWGRELLPQGPIEEQREVLPTSEEDRDSFEESLDRPEMVERRKLLTRTLGLAGAAMAAALVFPIRSLGPSTGRTLERTAWRRGSRVVDEKGRLIRAEDLVAGGLLTVFPEGHNHGISSADSQAVLVRVQEGEERPLPGRENWSPEGILGYSKLCTHAGCPVGLYQADTNELLCPCHQSAFNVLDGAQPVFGPATRPLPQLPLEIDGEGYLRAVGDFSDPVGPAYWERP